MARFGRATIAIGLAVGALPATAAARSVTPATLAGETLTASSSVDAPPYPFFLPCGDGDTSAPDFSFAGTAAGPFPGSFTESGKISWNPSVPGPDGNGGPVTSYSSSFRITAQNATITGSETLVDTGAQASCWGSAGGAGVDIHKVVATYSATIMTPVGTYDDHGRSSIDLGQSFGSGQDWTGYVDDSLTAAPASVTPPTVAGTPAEGQVLAESHGTWTGSPSHYTHRWERCDRGGDSCAPIAGATAQTYALSSADVGATIRVEEWATNDAGTSGPVTSPATPAVQAATTPPPPPGPSTVPPSQPGTPAVGSSPHPPTTGASIKLQVRFPRALSALALMRHERYTWTIRAPRAGRLVVAWYRGGKLVALGSARFRKAGSVRIIIRLTAAGRRLLRHGRIVRLTSKTTYTPLGGTADSASRPLTLRR